MRLLLLAGSYPALIDRAGGPVGVSAGIHLICRLVDPTFVWVLGKRVRAIDKHLNTQSTADPVILCAQSDAVSRAAQPCGVRRADDAMRLGADVTRQEFEFMLSGVCSVADCARVNG